jgi:hypothetical protein
VIAFLLFLAKAVGKAAGILSRTQSALGRSQTRLLTAAQKRGWTPATDEELSRLSQRQFKVWCYDAERKMAKRMASGEPLFETVPKEKP